MDPEITQRIVAQWNDLPNLNPVWRMSQTRRRKLSTRWSHEWGKNDEERWETFHQIHAKITASSFLQGHNEINWQADFDWLIKNDTNWLRIVEGRYDDKTKPGGRTIT